MGKLKSIECTAKRIIEKIESGDYDPSIIEHMIGSIVKNRDQRIKILTDKMRPRKFVLTEKKVAGALRCCIKAHGDITKQNINSAAKRIYCGCVELESPPLPPIVRVDNPTVSVVYDKNSKHKLTVARDGNIRIKIAKNTKDDEGDYIIDSFTKIAKVALTLKQGTLRGDVKPGRPQETVSKITLYNDSKTQHFTYNY